MLTYMLTARCSRPTALWRRMPVISSPLKAARDSKDGRQVTGICTNSVVTVASLRHYLAAAAAKNDENLSA